MSRSLSDPWNMEPERKAAEKKLKAAFMHEEERTPTQDTLSKLGAGQPYKHCLYEGK